MKDGAESLGDDMKDNMESLKEDIPSEPTN